MTNEIKTVEQIREDVNEYLTSIGPGEFPSETQMEEFADEFVASHKREIAEKDDSRLIVVANYDAVIATKDRIIAAKDAEIASLRALVKELADALEMEIVCHEDCDSIKVCAGVKRCDSRENRALVAKAREVCR